MKKNLLYSFGKTANVFKWNYFLYLYKKKKFLLMKKISSTCPKKLISSYRKIFAATAQNKVKNINPQPLEVVIYILQVNEKVLYNQIILKSFSSFYCNFFCTQPSFVFHVREAFYAWPYCRFSLCLGCDWQDCE